LRGNIGFTGMNFKESKKSGCHLLSDKIIVELIGLGYFVCECPCGPLEFQKYISNALF